MRKAVINLVLLAVPVVFLSGCGNSARMNVPSLNQIERVDVAAAIESTPEFTPAKDTKVISSILNWLHKATVISQESAPQGTPIVVASILLKDGTDIRLFPEYQSNKPVANRVIYEKNAKTGGEVIVLESSSLWDWLMGGWTKQTSNQS